MVAASEIISKPRSCRRFLRSGLRGFRASNNTRRAAHPHSSNSYLLTSDSSLSYDHKRLLCETDAVGGAISQTYASDTTEEFGDLIGEDGQYIHQYDARANTNALLDDTGTVHAQYKYYAFGQVSAVSIDGGSWTAEDWQSLPLDFTSNMLAGGKKQYYLDQEIALYLLGGGNNGRYYDAATGRFLSEDPTGEAGGDANLFRYTGNDPINNLDPSGHDSRKDPPKPVYHPPQTQQGQQHNQPPAQQQSSNARRSAETSIERQVNSAPENYLRGLGESPKAGEPLAGAPPGVSDQNSQKDPLDISHAIKSLQHLQHNENKWMTGNNLGSGTTTPTEPFALTQDQRDIAQHPTTTIGGVSVPTNIAQNSEAAFDAREAAIGQAIAAGDFKKAGYLAQHEFDIPELPAPNVKLPPGAGQIPGVQYLVNTHADWMTGHLSLAVKNMKRGFASLAMTLVTGMAGKSKLVSRLLGGSPAKLEEEMGLAEKAGSQIHHIMSNKNFVSTAAGGPYSQQFEKLAAQRGISLESTINKIALEGHRGPHPEYNRLVYQRLQEATKGLKGKRFAKKFDRTMTEIRSETATPGTRLNRLATGQ